MRNTKFILVILLLIIAYLPSYGQRVICCDVYQYLNNDSINPKLVLQQIFNEHGKILTETYKDFQEDTYTHMTDGKYSYLYNDTILVMRRFESNITDDSKTIYFYDKHKRLKRREHFSFQKRLKKGVDKGLGCLGGCIITEDDYEKERIWIQTSITDYTYDKRGNKILADATKLHYAAENKYIWAYDSENRISEHSVYVDNKLFYTEKFSYFKNGHKITNIGRDSSPIPDKTRTYYLNKDGKTIKEIIETTAGELIGTITYSYGSDRRIFRRVYYNSEGNPTVTHIYKYNFDNK